MSAVKAQYKAAIQALGGDKQARRDSPHEYAAIKRRFAPMYGDVKKSPIAANMMASAAAIEAVALAAGIPKPHAGGGAGH
jgi:hypothetical protein